jgi:hypothetical protein
MIVNFRIQLKQWNVVMPQAGLSASSVLMKERKAVGWIASIRNYKPSIVSNFY